jgi:large subunit ribosomal protein L17
MSQAKRRKALRSASGRRYRTGQPRGKLAFTGETISHKLIHTIGERYSERPGGYTRLIKLARRRIGDGGQLAVLQFVGDEEGPGSVMKPAKSARQRRADSRYALAVKLAKQRRGTGQPQPAPAKENAPSDDAPVTDAPASADEPSAEDSP